MSVDKISLASQIKTPNNMTKQKLDIKKNKNSVKIKYSKMNIEKNSEYSDDVSIDSFENILKDSNDKIKAFEDFIDKIISYQGSKSISIRKLKVNIKIELEEVPNGVESNEAEPAQDLGVWSAESVSTKILDFAKNLAGNNSDKYDMLLDAFKEGFERAKEAFGGELPEVSQKTYDLVIEGFEKLKEGQSSSIEEINVDD